MWNIIKIKTISQINVYFSIIVEKVCTKDGMGSCKFPFYYKGNLFHKCTTSAGYDGEWCYTKKNWGYCEACNGMTNEIPC